MKGNMFMGLKGADLLIGGCPACGRQDCVALSCQRKETDPNGKSPHEPGAKLDAGKSPLFQGLLDYFPRACEAVAFISAFGATKYTWKGWEDVPDGINRYENALVRHIIKEGIEGHFDLDSGYLHKAHRAWNDLAALELYLREQEKQQ